MPDQNLPNPVPPRPLSPSGRRALAAAMLGTATQLPPLVCSFLVDAVDTTSWSLLASSGATPLEARTILAVLWVTE
jgi:hypothetical protein